MNRLSELEARSEFAGDSYSDQRRMIVEGQKHLAQLFDRPITAFVPQWNMCDRTTVRILAELGFGYLLAGMEPPHPTIRNLAIIPRTYTLRALKAAVTEARPFADLDPLAVVILHHFNFAESGEAAAGIALDDLEALLRWL